ncbi:MAG: hypothetical protein ACW967_06670 [Candidatus Hodarchaeales archaeon]
MKNPGKTSIVIFFTFLFFVSTLLVLNTNVGGNIKNTDEFNSWDKDAFPTSGCNCHNGGTPGIIVGSGALNISAPTTVGPGLLFSVNISINGFTEAAGKEITVGFRTADEENANFVGENGIFTENTPLNATGDTETNITLNGFFGLPPNKNYTLQALAVYADDITPNDFYYLSNTVEVEIAGEGETEPPSINSVQIDSADITNVTQTISETIIVTVDASDNLGMKQVSVTINEGTPNVLEPNNVTGLYEYSLNTFFEPNGQLKLTIFAEDTLGNNASITYVLEVSNSGVTGDITSFKMAKSEIVIGDSVIDDYWDNIKDEDKFIVEELSSDTVDGWVKSTHDDYYLYMLVAYANERITWIAFELDASEENMADGNDGWVFGEGVIPYYGDVYYIGDAEHPAVDNRNDISYEMFLSEEEEINYIEFKRPLITNDEEGKDINLEEGSIYNIKIASNGKATYHKDNEKQVYTLAISQSFPSGGTGTTTDTTPTETRTPQELKDDRIINFFVLSGLGVSLNLALIATIFIFLRRK